MLFENGHIGSRVIMQSSSSCRSAILDLKCLHTCCLPIALIFLATYCTHLYISEMAAAHVALGFQCCKYCKVLIQGIL